MQTWKEWGSWSKLYFNSLQLFPLFVTSHVSRMMMFPEQVEWDSISESSTWCLDICFLTAVALVRKILNRQKTQQKYFVVFAKKKHNFPYSSNILSSPLIRVQERPRYPLLPKTKTAMRAALCAWKSWSFTWDLPRSTSLTILATLYG